MAKNKPTSAKTRAGGQRPLATTRKTIEGKTLAEQIRAAEHGETDPQIEQVGQLIVLVRQFNARCFLRESGLQALPVPRSDLCIWPTKVAGCDPTTFESVVVPVVSECIRYLGEWLSQAEPDQLSAMADLLKNRPIEPRRDISPDGKILGLRPADPNLHAALKISMIGLAQNTKPKSSPPAAPRGSLGSSVTKKTKNGATTVEYSPIERLVQNLVDWPAEERNKWSKRIKPDSNPTDLQKLANKAFGTKRKSGRPQPRR